MSSFKVSVIVTLGMTVLLATGCSSTPADEDLGPFDDSSSGPRLFEDPAQGAAWAEENGYSLMAEQLGDGQITPEEYQVSYESHVACREGAGWTYSRAEAVWNPVDHLKLIREGEAPSAPDPDKELVCNEQFDYVDYVFQTTTTPRMEPQLMSAVQHCLGQEEVTYSVAATNLPDLVGPDAGNSDDAEKIAECVRTEVALLYPDLPGLSIAF